jgi:hypothetical protein
MTDPIFDNSINQSFQKPINDIIDVRKNKDLSLAHMGCAESDSPSLHRATSKEAAHRESIPYLLVVDEVIRASSGILRGIF